MHCSLVLRPSRCSRSLTSALADVLQLPPVFLTLSFEVVGKPRVRSSIHPPNTESQEGPQAARQHGAYQAGSSQS